MKMEVLKVSQQMMSESIKMALLRWTIKSFHQINYSFLKIVSNVRITKNVVQLIQASKEVFADHDCVYYDQTWKTKNTKNILGMLLC